MNFIVIIGKATVLLFATMTKVLIVATSPFWAGYGTYYGAERLWGSGALTLTLGLGVGVLTFALVQYLWRKSLEQSATVVFPAQYL